MSETGIIERLRRYVEVETPTGDEAANRRLGEIMAADLEAAGATVERIPSPGWGDHLRARVPGATDEAPLLAVGHLDTVHPVGTLAQRPFRIADGRVEGPGTYDMKAGVAVLIEALEALRRDGARPRRPLDILITCDEEVGSGTSRALIEDAGRAAAAAIVLEPSLPGGVAKTGRKGVGVYTLVARGVAAHAGIDPEKGVSAVRELAHQILAVHELADPARGTTINIGVVRGGTATNVIPEEARAEVDVRYVTADEARRVDEAIQALRPRFDGARLEIGGGINRFPLERTDGVVRLLEQAREAAAAAGFELGEGSTGGASDGNLVAAVGTPVLDGLGPDGGGAHAAHEHVLAEDLPRRVAFVRGLLERL